MSVDGPGTVLRWDQILSRELTALDNRIARCRTWIEAQQILLEVLERDGHELGEQEFDVKQRRAGLALLVADQLRLLKVEALATD